MPSTISAINQPAQLPSTASPGKKWLHNHPVVPKILALSLGIFGLKTAFDGIQNASITTLTSGLFLSGCTYATNLILPIFIPPTHSYKEKAFKEGSYNEITLKYSGDLPILTIPEKTSPYDAGYGHGYLLASQIKKMHERNLLLFSTLLQYPTDIPNLVEKMKNAIPKNYLDEMQGIVDGYNAKRAEWHYLKGNPITLEDLMFFHLLPDTGHLIIKEAEGWCRRQNERSMMACTVIIDGDKETGPQALRTIDWQPMDIYGTNSFMIKREHTIKSLASVGQAFPGFIGGLTVMNSSGLTATINANRGTTNYPKNMPAVFFIRELIERCNDLKEAKEYCKTHSPLGAFTMSLLDKKRAAVVHFYQNSDRTHHIRKWQPGTPLVALNFRWGEEGPTVGDSTNSAERMQEINNYYKGLKEKEEETTAQQRLEELRKGKEVNNIRTTTTAFLHPKEGTFLTSADNGYAGDQKLRAVPNS